MKEFGHSGYVVFFGVLEIYAREFSVEEHWKLSGKLSFFCHKLLISCSRFQKILRNIKKWEVEFNGDEVTIFIPKFRQLMDESTLKKLREIDHSFRNRSRIVPKSNTTDVDVDVDKDKESTYCAKTDFSFFSFELFWNAFEDKRGKESAIKSWQKIPKLTEELAEKIIEGAKRYALERKNILAKGGTPKMAQGWLSDRRWEDEFVTKEDWKEKLREEHGN